MTCSGCGCEPTGMMMYMVSGRTFSLCCACKVAVTQPYNDVITLRDRQLAAATDLAEARLRLYEGAVRRLYEGREKRLSAYEVTRSEVLQGIEGFDNDATNVVLEILDAFYGEMHDEAAEPEPRPEDEPDAD